MDDREKETFERIRALETNRENDQDAIKLLRDGKNDSTTTYLALAASVIGVLGIILAAIGIVLQLVRH